MGCVIVLLVEFRMTSNVSVYVLRERLQETWEKRGSLKMQEEEILREAIQGMPYSAKMMNSGLSLHDQALTAVLENTEGYENLQSWRRRVLNKA